MKLCLDLIGMLLLYKWTMYSSFLTYNMKTSTTKRRRVKERIISVLSSLALCSQNSTLESILCSHISWPQRISLTGRHLKGCWLDESHVHWMLGPKGWQGSPTDIPSSHSVSYLDWTRKSYPKSRVNSLELSYSNPDMHINTTAITRIEKKYTQHKHQQIPTNFVLNH